MTNQMHLQLTETLFKQVVLVSVWVHFSFFDSLDVLRTILFNSGGKKYE